MLLYSASRAADPLFTRKYDDASSDAAHISHGTLQIFQGSLLNPIIKHVGTGLNMNDLLICERITVIKVDIAT